MVLLAMNRQRASGRACDGFLAVAWGGAMDEGRIIPPLERQYDSLGAHLAAQRAAGLARCTLSFGAIEAILGRQLPRTARHPRGHRQWWVGLGAGLPHAWYGWQRVGWRVETVDLAAETVTFARTSAAP